MVSKEFVLLDGNIASELVLIVICVAFSAFFSFSETVLTGLGESRVHKLIAENNKYRSLLELWINRQFRVLTTIMLGNTIALVAATVLTLDLAAKLFPAAHIAPVAAVTAVILLVFGELLPKAFGRSSSEHFAITCIYIVRIFHYIVYPITFITAAFADLLTRMIGKKNEPQLTEEDITYLLDVSEEQGVLEEGAQQMISSILEISDTYVKEVMVPRTDMIAVSSDISKDELLILMADNEHSRLPVYEETLDKVIGILYAKDLIKIMRMDWQIVDFMSTMHEPLFVPETKHIDEMLKEFQRQRQQMAIVVDEYGGVAGIVTMEDILEEIVGDIWDEYDDDDQEIIAMGENEFRVDARMNIDDLCSHFGVERTDDISDFDTVGGLVYDVAGAIPSEGERFSWRGYEIVIRKMTDNRLEEVDFIKMPTQGVD